MAIGLQRPEGSVGLTVIRASEPYVLTKQDVIGHTQAPNFKRVWKEFKKIEMARKLGIATFYGQLRIKVFRFDGKEEDYGLVSLRVVTDTGVAFIVDAFQNIVELEIMKYHGIGTGVTAESAAQTALVTESTTALNPDSTRATGSTIEAAANIYQTVGTLTVDAAVAATEHGIFSQAATGGGVMIDRSLFSAVNLAIGDSIQTDYRLTFASGG